VRLAEAINRARHFVCVSLGKGERDVFRQFAPVVSEWFSIPRKKMFSNPLREPLGRLNTLFLKFLRNEILED